MEEKLKVQFTETYGCPSCGDDFQSEGTPQTCPLCGYNPNEDGHKGGFAIGGFGGV